MRIRSSSRLLISMSLALLAGTAFADTTTVTGTPTNTPPPAKPDIYNTNCKTPVRNALAADEALPQAVFRVKFLQGKRVISESQTPVMLHSTSVSQVSRDTEYTSFEGVKTVSEGVHYSLTLHATTDGKAFVGYTYNISKLDGFQNFVSEAGGTTYMEPKMSVDAGCSTVMLPAKGEVTVFSDPHYSMVIERLGDEATTAH